MVNLCFSMSISNSSVLTMWQGKPQKQKELQNSHHDDEKKGWGWDVYVALYKKQHKSMESFADHGYSGSNNDTEIVLIPSPDE